MTHNGNFDAFVSKLNPAGGGSSDLMYSSFLGGGANDFGFGIAVDSSSIIHLTGKTYDAPTDFPTLAKVGSNTPYDSTHNGSYDVYVTKMDTDTVPTTTSTTTTSTTTTTTTTTSTTTSTTSTTITTTTVSSTSTTSTTTTTTTSSTTTTTLTCDCPADAVDPKGCISGQITYGDSNLPLQGKTVKLKGVKPKRPKVLTTTDSNGCYHFSDLYDGKYKVVIKCGSRRKKQVKLIDNGNMVNGVDFHCASN